MYSKRSYTRMRNLFTRTEHLLRRLRRIELMNETFYENQKDVRMLKT